MCAVVLLVVIFQQNVSSVPSPEVSASHKEVTDAGDRAVLGDILEPSAEVEPQSAIREIVSNTVRSGQSFYSIMSAHGFSSPTIAKLVAAFRGVFDCRKISAGDEYQLVTDQEGKLVNFTIMTSPVDIFTLSQEDGGLVAGKEKVVLEKEVGKISGVIEHSLFGALASAGEKDQLAIQFADIFAWDIDFRINLRAGDQFKIVFEKYLKNGQFVRYGKILAAEYQNEQKTFQAICYQDSECSEDYFTPEGNSVRRSFLRSPLRFTRISSGYSQSRLHPVLRIYRPHLGVDFAAPTGTPVRAVGDGVVVRKGWKNGNGNMVAIRHPNGYETMYNHLSRYGKGIKRGKHVRQKDIIGYVGMTGLSTGPHLDYRMKRNGRFINPLKEKFPAGTPVPKASRTTFLRVANQMIGLLGNDDVTTGTVVAELYGDGGSGSSER